MSNTPSPGGEKRRVSVAAELLTRPSLLFMDEPTTGLDSSSAAMLVDFLADFSTSGPCVVLSIHQPRPDIFRLMQRMLLLSGGGQVRGFGWNGCGFGLWKYGWQG